MQFGALAGNFGTFGEEPGVDGCLAVADAAERLGYDSVWVHDHVVMPAHVTSTYHYTPSGASPFHVAQHIYDPLAVMAAIAARTEQVRIGTSVLIVPYRNPLVLAKSLATIDRIAHGRVVLGIGVGWMAEEFEALGIGDLWAERGLVTDEYMAACIDLWTQDGPSSFDGRFVRYRDVGANPRPVQRPHIPIWVGGKTKPAIRRVARYGSGYHSVASTPAELAVEVAAVRAEVERAGRDPDGIVVSMLAAFVGPRAATELVDLVGAYREAGLHHLVGVPSTRPGPPAADPYDRLTEALEDLERFAAEVIPAVR
jgi:probable F420-dependent oxidoreductase